MFAVISHADAEVNELEKDSYFLARTASRCRQRAYVLPTLMSPRSFENGWMDRIADYCINTVNEKVITATNLVKFGAVTPEILWLICMGSEST